MIATKGWAPAKNSKRGLILVTGFIERLSAVNGANGFVVAEIEATDEI